MSAQGGQKVHDGNGAHMSASAPPLGSAAARITQRLGVGSRIERISALLFAIFEMSCRNTPKTIIDLLSFLILSNQLSNFLNNCSHLRLLYHVHFHRSAPCTGFIEPQRGFRILGFKPRLERGGSDSLLRARDAKCPHEAPDDAMLFRIANIIQSMFILQHIKEHSFLLSQD